MNSFVEAKFVAWIEWRALAACIEVLITSDVAPNIHLELITTLLSMRQRGTTRMIIFTFGCIRWTWIFLPRVISHLPPPTATKTHAPTPTHFFYLRLATWSLHLKLRVKSQNRLHLCAYSRRHKSSWKWRVSVAVSVDHIGRILLWMCRRRLKNDPHCCPLCGHGFRSVSSDNFELDSIYSSPHYRIFLPVALNSISRSVQACG